MAIVKTGGFCGYCFDRFVFVSVIDATLAGAAKIPAGEAHLGGHIVKTRRSIVTSTFHHADVGELLPARSGDSVINLGSE